jgi:hypothetical protein
MGMSCRDFRELAAIDALGALEPEDRARLALHLDTCRACAEYRRSLDRLPPLLDLAAAGPAEVVPAGLEERIVHRYSEDAGAQRRRRRRERLRWFAPAAAGLALGVAATLIAIAAIAGHGPQPTSVALHGTALAPAATAVATMEPAAGGTRIRFTGSHLPASKVDQHYELWMSYGSRAISAGTFRVGADGTVTSTMTCAGDPDEYTRLDVTLETDAPQTGSSQHQVVMIGNTQST